MKPFTTTALAILALIALSHLVRFFLRTAAAVGSFGIPVWWSLVIALALGALVVLVWREQHQPLPG